MNAILRKGAPDLNQRDTNFDYFGFQLQMFCCSFIKLFLQDLFLFNKGQFQDITWDLNQVPVIQVKSRNELFQGL